MGGEPSPASSHGLHRVDEPSVLQTFAQQADTVSGPGTCAAARLGESNSKPTTAAPAADETRNLLMLIASFSGNLPALGSEASTTLTATGPSPGRPPDELEILQKTSNSRACDFEQKALLKRTLVHAQ